MNNPQNIENTKPYSQEQFSSIKNEYVKYWDEFGIPPSITTNEPYAYSIAENCYDTKQLEKCVFGAIAKTWRHASAPARARKSTELYLRKQRTNKSAAIRDTTVANALSRRTLQRSEDGKTLPNQSTLKQLSELMGLPQFYAPRTTRSTENIQIKYQDLSVNEDDFFLPDFILDVLWCFKKIRKIQRSSFRGVSRYKHANMNRSNDVLNHKEVIEYQSLYYAINTMMNTTFSITTNRLRIICSYVNTNESILINPSNNPTQGYLALRYLEKIIQIKQDDSTADKTLFFIMSLLNHCFDTLDYILFSRRRELAACGSFYALSYFCSKDIHGNNIPEYIVFEDELLEIGIEYRNTLNIDKDLKEEYWYQSKDSFAITIKNTFKRLNLDGVLQSIANNL